MKLDRQQQIINAMPLARMLAFKIARRHHLESYEPEDCVGEAYLGLCQAADIYDPKKGTFNTIAGRKAGWQVKEALRNQDSFIKTTRLMIKNKETPVIISIENAPWKDDPGIETFEDVLPDEKNEKSFQDILERDYWQSVLETLPKDERIIIEAIMRGETMLQLSEKDPRSHGHLLNERTRILKKLRQELKP